MFYLPLTFLKSTGFNFFAEIMGEIMFFVVQVVLTLTLQPTFKKRLWQSCFPVNFAKFLRTPFFIEHLWWLLL